MRKKQLLAASRASLVALARLYKASHFLTRYFPAADPFNGEYREIGTDSGELLFLSYLKSKLNIIVFPSFHFFFFYSIRFCCCEQHNNSTVGFSCERDRQRRISCRKIMAQKWDNARSLVRFIVPIEIYGLSHRFCFHSLFMLVAV